MMIPEHFQRLPESIQQVVINGLDDEIMSGLEKLEQANLDPSATKEAVKFIEGDVFRATQLRNTFVDIKDTI